MCDFIVRLIVSYFYMYFISFQAIYANKVPVEAFLVSSDRNEIKTMPQCLNMVVRMKNQKLF